MKAINCQEIPVAGYEMNVCNLGVGDQEGLDMIMKNILRREEVHGRQSSDEGLYTKRKQDEEKKSMMNEVVC